MKEKMLYAIWGVLFILCAGLGFIPQRDAFMSAMLTILSVLFFIPGAVLLYDAIGAGQTGTIIRIRLIAIFSLGLTMLLLFLIFLNAAGSETVGTLLQILLTIVAAPMLCSKFWALSLFLWACLLFGSFVGTKKR